MARTLISESNIREMDIREESALTISYVSSESFNIQGANQLQLLVSFTKGDSQGCNLIIEFSEDTVNWYQESALALSDLEGIKEVIHMPVVRKIESSSSIVISVPISASFFRIKATAIEYSSNTLLAIKGTIANI